MAQYRFSDGRRLSRSFETEREAAEWLDEQKRHDDRLVSKPRTAPTKARHDPFSVTIRLDQEMWEALITEASRLDRPTDWQAKRLLRWALGLPVEEEAPPRSRLGDEQPTVSLDEEVER